MLEPLLNALLPAQPSAAPRRMWLAAILLFPVALVGGYLLLLRNSPPRPVQATADSAKAIAIARAFLIAQGVPAGSWQASCKANTDANLLNFANRKAERIALWQVAPPMTAGVVFRSSGEEGATVNVSVDGRVVGFEWKRHSLSGAHSEAMRDDAAMKMALAQVPADAGFGAPSVDRIGAKREYTFRSSKIPDAEVTETVTIEGSRLVSFETKAEPNDDLKTPTSERVQTPLTIAASLFLCAVVLFSIFRYASRTLQQEVSHQRSLVVGLLCAFFCVFLGFNAVVDTTAGSVPFAVILLVFAATGVVGGAVLAAAYSSGEGDIREAFPGKLTSLDALLTGRIFSRNTGISALFGMACAGWLILALGIATIPFATSQPQGSAGMGGLYVRYGTLMPMVMYPLIALSYTAAGLLQPLAFLKRYVPRKRRWHLPVLLMSAGLVSTLRTHGQSTGEFLVTSAVLVAALLAPFFLLDLLATMVCIMTVGATMDMALRVSVIPAFSGTALLVYIGLAAGAVVLSIVCISRGRTYREAQVRPLYAKHIEQRKSLEAEVSAAREAQLRLLPDSTPVFAGLDISAACVPAETVGGDFYDFFPLGDGRLGIFIAEGNNRGLAAALTIALAKGYLMQCVERFREPVEILTRLEAMLSSIFPPDMASGRSALTDFAFASVDTIAGEIRYARTGTYPKVVVVSSGSAIATERAVPVKGRQSPLSEGRAALGPGDRAVLFTDGIGRRLACGNRRPEDAAASLIARSGGPDGGTADQVRERFFKDTRASTEPDDLTLVVIQMQARAEFEGVAALGVVA